MIVCIATPGGLQLVERDDAPRNISYQGHEYQRFEVRNTDPDQTLVGYVYATGDHADVMSKNVVTTLLGVPREERLRGYKPDA
ncbi:MAG: hypothetical protein ACRETY_08415 [Steroidobacteraceae bacterium]